MIGGRIIRKVLVAERDARHPLTGVFDFQITGKMARMHPAFSAAHVRRNGGIRAIGASPPGEIRFRKKQMCV